MQLSMHNFILQYDGFHHLHFATSGLMQVVRNNSSSLKPSNPLGSTRCAASHDWRRHHCHMHASSVCSLNTEHNIPVEKHPCTTCQQWTKQWIPDFHHSGRFWQDGFFFSCNHSGAHLPKCFISFTHDNKAYCISDGTAVVRLLSKGK